MTYQLLNNKLVEQSQEWRIEPCGAPLFSYDDKTICRGCKEGWTHPHNYPLDCPENRAIAPWYFNQLSAEEVERQISEMWDALADSQKWCTPQEYAAAHGEAVMAEKKLRSQLLRET